MTAEHNVKPIRCKRQQLGVVSTEQRVERGLNSLLQGGRIGGPRDELCRQAAPRQAELSARNVPAERQPLDFTALAMRHRYDGNAFDFEELLGAALVGRGDRD